MVSEGMAVSLNSGCNMAQNGEKCIEQDAGDHDWYGRSATHRLFFEDPFDCGFLRAWKMCWRHLLLRRRLGGTSYLVQYVGAVQWPWSLKLKTRAVKVRMRGWMEGASCRMLAPRGRERR